MINRNIVPVFHISQEAKSIQVFSQGTRPANPNCIAITICLKRWLFTYLGNIWDHASSSLAARSALWTAQRARLSLLLRATRVVKQRFVTVLGNHVRILRSILPILRPFTLLLYIIHYFLLIGSRYDEKRIQKSPNAKHRIKKKPREYDGILNFWICEERNQKVYDHSKGDYCSIYSDQHSHDSRCPVIVELISSIPVCWRENADKCQYNLSCLTN